LPVFAGEGEYEVEDIQASRIIEGTRKYLVKWKGYPVSSNTWEEETNFLGSTAKKMLAAFKAS
jgi:hypothetical protein